VAIKDALRKLGLKEIGRNAKYYDPREFNQNKVIYMAANMLFRFKEDSKYGEDLKQHSVFSIVFLTV
jgi:hypothetical protein